MDKKEIQKPFILEMDEAKTEIAQAINNAIQVRRLPLSIVDMILSEFYIQVKDGAKQEIAMARAQMENNEEAE